MCQDQAAPNSPELLLLIFTINLPSQPFLGRHLRFHIFFHHSLSQGHTIFLQLGCFGLDILYFIYVYGIHICDLICEKGSYSLSKLSSLTNHNSSFFNLSPSYYTKPECYVRSIRGTNCGVIPYSQVKLQVAKYMQLKRLQDPLSQTGSHILYSFMQSIQTNQFTKIVLLLKHS